MAAVSYAVSRGSGMKISDFTHGTSAPGAGDIELRVNTTDANAVLMTVNDIIQALEKFKIAVMSEQYFGSDWGI